MSCCSAPRGVLPVKISRYGHFLRFCSCGSVELEIVAQRTCRDCGEYATRGERCRQCQIEINQEAIYV
jgi:hypothetical protein